MTPPRTLLLATALAWAAAASAGETVKTDAFQLRLEGDWKRLPGGAPEQQSFASKAQDAHLAVAFLLVKEGAQATEKLARQYRDVRLEAEQQLAEEAGLKVTLTPATVTPIPGGQRVDYGGRDDQRRRFRLRALVLPRKVVSLYLESYSRSDQELAALMDRLTQGLSY